MTVHRFFKLAACSWLEMLMGDADTYSITGYDRRPPVVLARLARIGSASEGALLLISWRMAKAKAGGGTAPQKPDYGC